MLINVNSEKDLIISLFILNRPKIGFYRKPEDLQQIIWWRHARSIVMKTFGITAKEVKERIKAIEKIWKDLDAIQSTPEQKAKIQNLMDRFNKANVKIAREEN